MERVADNEKIFSAHNLDTLLALVDQTAERFKLKNDCFGQLFDLDETACRLCHSQTMCAAHKAAEVIHNLEDGVQWLDLEIEDTLDLKCINFLSIGNKTLDDLIDFIEQHKKSDNLNISDFLDTLFEENSLSFNPETGLISL